MLLPSVELFKNIFNTWKILRGWLFKRILTLAEFSMFLNNASLPMGFVFKFSNRSYTI